MQNVLKIILHRKECKWKMYSTLLWKNLLITTLLRKLNTISFSPTMQQIVIINFPVIVCKFISIHASENVSRCDISQLVWIVN